MGAAAAAAGGVSSAAINCRPAGKSGVTTRAFLAGTAVNGVTPLVFQDAAAVAAEGLNVLPFGAPTEASANGAQERQVQLGLRLEF